MVNKNIPNKIRAAVVKIIGDKTQNQLQLIKPVSLSPMNRIVSKPTNPIPPLELELELDLLDIKITSFQNE